MKAIYTLDLPFLTKLLVFNCGERDFKVFLEEIIDLRLKLIYDFFLVMGF